MPKVSSRREIVTYHHLIVVVAVGMSAKVNGRGEENGFLNESETMMMMSMIGESVLKYH